jgi:(E)-4-hydroxy-3-methylbut-2-enyl-diphosphate synthase
MKSSNPQVMVQAYRLLIRNMEDEFGACYPLHLGVTEAGDGEDGRIKSAIGIGTLLEDGIGDTIRVSLTEDPEFEIPVCKDLVKRYEGRNGASLQSDKSVPTAETGSASPFGQGSPVDDARAVIPPIEKIPYSPFDYQRRKSVAVSTIGDHHVPVVVADFMKAAGIRQDDLTTIGYSYDLASDKWNIGDAAADYLYTGKKTIDFELPGTLKIICDHRTWLQTTDRQKYLPLYQGKEYLKADEHSTLLNFVSIDTAGLGKIGSNMECMDAVEPGKTELNKSGSNMAGRTTAEMGAAGSDQAVTATEEILQKIKEDPTVVLCLWSSHPDAMPSVRRFIMELMNRGITCPLILAVESQDNSIDEQLIHFSTEAGALFLDGMGDGIWLMNDPDKIVNTKVSGRTYLQAKNNHQFINNTSFSILQATRTRISKTEYISCPSCGRTLFDLQETTGRIRSVTHHLKGVKIAIMGCIVNGPGEMADADFGYVGSGPGKITLYRGKEVVKRGVDSAIAVEELINLLKESDAWIDPPLVAAHS